MGLPIHELLNFQEISKLITIGSDRVVHKEISVVKFHSDENGNSITKRTV